MIATNTAGMVYRPDEDQWYEIPWDQWYYWTEEWQQGERESAKARAEGQTVILNSDEAIDEYFGE